MLRRRRSRQKRSPLSLLNPLPRLRLKRSSPFQGREIEGITSGNEVMPFFFSENTKTKKTQSFQHIKSQKKLDKKIPPVLKSLE
jgi:hypothetical protein